MTKERFLEIQKEAMEAIQEISPQELMLYPKLMELFHKLKVYRNLK